VSNCAGQIMLFGTKYGQMEPNCFFSHGSGWLVLAISFCGNDSNHASLITTMKRSTWSMMRHQINFRSTILQHLKIHRFGIYIALILFCCDLFGRFSFSNPCIVRCYIGKVWQVFGSGPALRLKKWVYRTVTTAVFIDWTHVEIAFIWLRFLTQMNSNDGSGWFDLFWSAGQRQNRVWCPSFGECDVSQGIGIISVECTASTIKQPGRATHSVMGQIHSQNPKPERPHIGLF